MQTAQFQTPTLTAAYFSSTLVPAAAQSAVGDWHLCKTTKVQQRLRFELSAFFMPALWWGVWRLFGAPVSFVSGDANSVHPATYRLASKSGRSEKHYTKDTTMSKHPSVIFNDKELSIIDKDGQQWLTATDIAKALGYASTDSIIRLYNRNKADFDSSMTCTVNLTVQGQRYEKRIFNKRGAQLIALMAKTKPARDFRKFVLDTLEAGATPQATAIDSPDSVWICIQRNGQFIKQERADVANLSRVVSEYLPGHILLERNVAANIIEQATDALQSHASKVASEAFTINLNLKTRLGLVESKALSVGVTS